MLPIHVALHCAATARAAVMSGDGRVVRTGVGLGQCRQNRFYLIVGSHQYGARLPWLCLRWGHLHSALTMAVVSVATSTHSMSRTDGRRLGCPNVYWPLLVARPAARLQVSGVSTGSARQFENCRLGDVSESESRSCDRRHSIRISPGDLRRRTHHCDPRLIQGANCSGFISWASSTKRCLAPPLHRQNSSLVHFVHDLDDQIIKVDTCLRLLSVSYSKILAISPACPGTYRCDRLMATTYSVGVTIRARSPINFDEQIAWTFGEE